MNTFTPQAGIAETAKAIIKHPRFATHFFTNLGNGVPEATRDFDARSMPSRSAALQSVLLAMIDNASGAPGAGRRLKAVANSHERRDCALTEDIRPLWLDSVIAATTTVNPAMSSELRTRLYNVFDAQAKQLLERVSPL